MRESIDTSEPEVVCEQPICPHCFEPVEPLAHFCPHCSAPTGATTAIDPIARVWAQGYFFQRLRHLHPVLWFVVLLLYFPVAPVLAVLLVLWRGGRRS